MPETIVISHISGKIIGNIPDTLPDIPENIPPGLGHHAHERTTDSSA